MNAQNTDKAKATNISLYRVDEQNALTIQAKFGLKTKSEAIRFALNIAARSNVTLPAQ